MKIGVIILFTCLVSACAVFKPKPVKSIIKNFEDENGSVMIVAHRANITDTLPENSLEGILQCIKNGIDIIEIDTQKTKDNVLVVMHDETLNRMTNGQGKVSDITLAELKKLNLRASNFGKITPYKVPTLEEVFSACKGQIMINVDKAFWWMDDVEKLAGQTGVTRQIIVKSYEDKPKVDERLGAFPFVYFMPIVSEGKFTNVEILSTYMNRKNSYLPESYELIFDKKDGSLFHPSMVKSIHDFGGRIWVNTISDGLCGGYSERKNATQNWETLIERGVNIIQTDSTLLLKEYLQNRIPTK